MAAKAALQGRRPGPEHPAGAGRPGHQADPAAAQHHARRGAREGAGAERLADEDPEIGRAARLRPAARGPAATSAPTPPGVVIADRPLDDARPAPEAPQQGQGQGGRQHPVGDGRRREGRPAEDGLPRPAEPDQPRRRRPPDRADARGEPIDLDRACRWTTRRPTSSSSAARPRGSSSSIGAGIRDLLIKMKPDRFADLIAILALYRPGPLNGGMVDDLRQPQARRARPRLPPPGHEGGPGRDLRRDGLPGAGDADPQPPGRHRAVAGVRVHQGDLQEEDRGHRPGPRRSSSRAASAQGRPRRPPRRSST